MKHVRTKLIVVPVLTLIVVGGALAAFFIIMAISRSLHLVSIPPEMKERWRAEREGKGTSNDVSQLNRKVFRPGLAGLSEEERAELKKEFETKLGPALDKWAEVYAEHLPFKPDEVSLANYYSRMGRGSYNVYTFMVNGATLSIEDAKGVARVMYLNTPETKKLMELPKGESPNMSMPVSREEVSKLIGADSGRTFTPDEVRMIPTAASSAMQGGVHVIVGGDTANAGSALYTLTFGPDKMLNYYMKGADILFQQHDKAATAHRR
jgi:hypothetical protein